MEQITNPTTTTTPAVTAEPMPVNPATPAPNYSNGGAMPMSTGGGGFVETLKSLNWLEVGFGILGSATLYFAINYYRYNINQRKKFEEEYQNKIDDLNMRIADISSVLSRQQNQNNDILFF